MATASPRRQPHPVPGLKLLRAVLLSITGTLHPSLRLLRQLSRSCRQRQ